MDTTTNNQSTNRLLRNSLVALVATALTALLWMLWWPLAAGWAWGGCHTLLNAKTSKGKRILYATAMACAVIASGMFAGTTGAALASFIGYMLLVLTIE